VYAVIFELIADHAGVRYDAAEESVRHYSLPLRLLPRLDNIGERLTTTAPSVVLTLTVQRPMETPIPREVFNTHSLISTVSMRYDGLRITHRSSARKRRFGKGSS
jgi:hypothetical protein